MAVRAVLAAACVAACALAQGDPALVGYISASGGYSDVRSCDYPQTLSTSGAYAQCCPTTGACAFYTSCAGNTLVAASTSVPCDFDGSLTCNAGIVKQTAGAAAGASYYACWQRTLGSTPFTFVRDIGTAAVAAPSSTRTSSGPANTGSAATGSASRASGSSSTGTTATTGSGVTAMLPTASARSTTASSSSSTATGGAGIGAGMSSGGGIVGLMALLAQMVV